MKTEKTCANGNSDLAAYGSEYLFDITRVHNARIHLKECAGFLEATKAALISHMVNAGLDSITLESGDTISLTLTVKRRRNR